MALSLAHSAAKMPPRPPRPPKLKPTGPELEARVAELRQELEVLEAHLACERKGIYGALTVEEVMAVTGFSRQSVMLKVRRKEWASVLVSVGKGRNRRTRRMVLLPNSWNQER